MNNMKLIYVDEYIRDSYGSNMKELYPDFIKWLKSCPEFIAVDAALCDKWIRESSQLDDDNTFRYILFNAWTTMFLEEE